MVGLVRHRQTKEPETDRPNLNHRATSRLYTPPDALPIPRKRLLHFPRPKSDNRLTAELRIGATIACAKSPSDFLHRTAVNIRAKLSENSTRMFGIIGQDAA